MKREGERFPEFKERFKKLVGDKSNTEFADFVGISRQTVGFYYNGDRIPDALTLRQIAQKCKVSADWLLGLSEAQTTNPDIDAANKLTGLSVDAITNLCDYDKQETVIMNVLLTRPTLYPLLMELYCLAGAEQLCGHLQDIVNEDTKNLPDAFVSDSLPSKFIHPNLRAARTSSELALFQAENDLQFKKFTLHQKAEQLLQEIIHAILEEKSTDEHMLELRNNLKIDAEMNATSAVEDCEEKRNPMFSEET